MLGYDDRGRGEPLLLLLHAFPLARFMWDAELEALAARRRVVAFDARGFGESALGLGPLTMERIADDAAALLDALGIERAVLGGCSMGGYAALAFARRHPRRLRALYLQDTRAGADSDEARQGRTALAERVLREGAGVAAQAFLPKLLGETTQREQPALVARLRERILATAPQAIANALQGLAARADSRPTLGELRVPTLVLVGAEDVLTPPAESEAMAAAVPGARLEVVPRAGHLSNLEQPAAVSRALAAFLASL
jgi:pimeloyl-ACP methyl ester carboxylesterase